MSNGTTYNVIDLTPDGEGNITVNLGNIIVSLVTRFNYQAMCWSMDIFDSQGNLLLAGLMLVPNIDILLQHKELKKTLGSMVLIEINDGDYQSPDLLGMNTALLWFAPGVEAVLPT